MAFNDRITVAGKFKISFVGLSRSCLWDCGANGVCEHEWPTGSLATPSQELMENLNSANVGAHFLKANNICNEIQLTMLISGF